METFTLIAIGIGILLMLLEIILPGAISFCLGLSCILVGLSFQFGIVTKPVNLFLLWCLLSIISSSIGIYIVNQLFAGTSTKGVYDEDVDAFGTEVEVLEDIDESNGRIQFQGTGWHAVTTDGLIPKGQKATIAGRDGSTFIVDSLTPHPPTLPEERKE